MPDSSMLTQEAAALLGRTRPFSCLDSLLLKTVTEEISLEFYPKGHAILIQNGPAAEHLRVIKSGAVKVFVRTNEGEEVLVDYRTAGDCFGMLSIVCGDISRDTVHAEEDTICYLIHKEVVLGLMKTNPDFSESCLRALIMRLVDMTYREINDRTLQYGGGDKLLFTNVLGDLATKQVIAASEEISIREAAALMADKGISSLVLQDSSGFPSGIITDRDLRNKVVSKGRDPGGRVGDIMSVTIIKSEARDYCFEALLKMIKYRIHHLLVVDKGSLKGIITNHDLMVLQGSSPLAVAREIESKDTIDSLEPVSKKIDNVISILIREGARASNITRLITEINDRLLIKVLEITERKLGPPPVSYCWIVYGSEGRKEQTFRTDQDNAIIYEDPVGNEAEVRDYFSRFGVQAGDALVRCGFPLCSAGYMAGNPRWCQPISVWKRYFMSWLQTPTPEAILQSLIFFDFRPVYGNTLMAEGLRAFLGREAKDRTIFLGRMAGVVVKNRPPLSLFGKFSGERKGANKGKFNIKLNALCPISDAARLSALEMRVYATPTLARLMELRGKPCIVGEFASELEYSFEMLMSLRLRHQFQQIQEGVAPDNFINPHDLGKMERRFLKETFRLILSVQEATRYRYGAWMTL
jgi:CBS domain-containing protein